MLISYYSSSIDVLSILKSFCGDYTKPANVRRAVLLLIEKVSEKNSNYLYFDFNYVTYTVFSATR